MKYYIKNNAHIIECDVSEFSIELVNKTKKNVSYDNYTNANFFGNYSEQGEKFTLPAGHLVADYNATGKWIKYYCEERGDIVGNKFFFDSSKWKLNNQFYNKNLSTLFISNGIAKIDRMKSISKNYDYAVSGVPVMKDGKDVKFYGDVTGEGYDGSTLYATKHIFVGMKKNDPKIYIIGYKTSTSNLVYSGEMFKKLSSLGMYNVIKLDGGGSYHFKANGIVKDTTAENRRINAILKITPKKEEVTIPNNNNNNNNNVSSWAKESWDKAVKKGIISNDNPQGVVTREMLMYIEDKLGNL